MAAQVGKNQVGWFRLGHGRHIFGQSEANGPEADRKENRSALGKQLETCRFAVAGQLGKGSKRRAPCQLENRCQLRPNRRKVQRA